MKREHSKIGGMAIVFDTQRIMSKAIKKLEPQILRIAVKLTSTRLNEKHLLRAGTSGFRGRNNERLVRNIAAYAVAFGEYLKPDKRVIIGYDERPCSQSNALLCSVILKYSGLDCEIVKESVTISCLAKKVLDSNKERGREVTYGVMCGASHNPLTDNGMNFIMGDGSIAEEDITNRLAEIVLKEELLLSSGMTEKPGEISVIDPTADYVNSIIGFVGKINRKDLVVVADPLNGAGRRALPKLIEALGVTCYVVQRKGFEGMRDLDPRHNLGPIRKEMKRRDAVLGVLIDGDGDRVMFVYPRAEEDRIILEEADFNEAFAVILEFLLTYMPVNAVSTNVASSSIFRDICKKHGINIYDWNPVGFKNQSRDMRRHPDQTIVGIEGNSGGFTVSSFSHEKDGCLAAALAIRMVAEAGSFAENIDQLREKYGKRYIREVNVSTPDLPTREARRAAAIFLTKEFKVGQTFCGKKIVAAVTVDGVKLNFTDGCSLLIRASGTEPKFRVVPETKIEKEVSTLVEAVKRRLIARDHAYLILD